MNASVPTIAIDEEAPTAVDAPRPRRESRLLPTPSQLRDRLPLTADLARRIALQRQAIRAILSGEDDRLLVITGPCSLHEADSALEYAERLAQLSAQVSDRLLLVMRAYVEKPRTTVGWKGMLYDPHLDGSSDMAEGLALSRRLMLAMVELGLPVATELLQPMAVGYLDDLLGWAAIGARTSESQVHREMVSGLDVPVGFKNGTDGSLGIACDAMGSASHPHQHFGVDDQGRPAVIQTQGNPDTHLVLRGGHAGPNFSPGHIAAARAELAKRCIAPRMIVDCSHANSGKDPLRQPPVLEAVVAQRLAGETSLRGVMLESHLSAGAQPLSSELAYGVSITDGCLGWAATESALMRAAARLR